jgi:hypothetical protein
VIADQHSAATLTERGQAPGVEAQGKMVPERGTVTSNQRCLARCPAMATWTCST